MATAQPGTDAYWFGILDQVNGYRKLDQARENLMIAAMLTGEECHLFGQRVRIRLEWPDGPPWGMAEEDLCKMGQDMKARAIADSQS
jgi:hypothetical protein